MQVRQGSKAVRWRCAVVSSCYAPHAVAKEVLPVNTPCHRTAPLTTQER